MRNAGLEPSIPSRNLVSWPLLKVVNGLKRRNLLYPEVGKWELLLKEEMKEEKYTDKFGGYDPLTQRMR